MRSPHRRSRLGACVHCALSEHRRRMRMHRLMVNMMVAEGEMMTQWANSVVVARQRLACAMGIGMLVQLPYCSTTLTCAPPVLQCKLTLIDM